MCLITLFQTSTSGNGAVSHICLCFLFHSHFWLLLSDWNKELADLKRCWFCLIDLSFTNTWSRLCLLWFHPVDSKSVCAVLLGGRVSRTAPFKPLAPCSSRSLVELTLSSLQIELWRLQFGISAPGSASCGFLVTHRKLKATTPPELNPPINMEAFKTPAGSFTTGLTLLHLVW